MTDTTDQIVRDIFSHLVTHRNVLLSGPPGTGKSRMLSAVAASFRLPSSPHGPALFPDQPIAIPADPPEALPGSSLLAGVSSVRVFETAFDQNTKHSDFMRGVVPLVGSAMGFRVSKGILFQAAEFAKQPEQAALVVIDEINRGPAVSIFGTTMVGLEPAKRLDNDGNPSVETQGFQVLDDDGELATYYLPSRLYILAAMNQADTSVEPMDVAFQRRFAPVTLHPDSKAAAEFLGLHGDEAPPAVATTAADVYAALLRAWAGINGRIASGKGDAFRMGHGMLMRSNPETSLEAATRQASDTWDLMYAHVAEVFYGDNRGLGQALGSENDNPAFVVEDSFFGDQLVTNLRLTDPNATSYKQLLAAR